MAEEQNPQPGTQSTFKLVITRTGGDDILHGHNCEADHKQLTQSQEQPSYLLQECSDHHQMCNGVLKDMDIPEVNEYLVLTRHCLDLHPLRRYPGIINLCPIWSGNILLYPILPKTFPI